MSITAISITPFGLAALAAALVIYVVSKFAPMPQPERAAKAIVTAVFLPTFVIAFTHIAAYPAALPLPTWVLGVIFFIIAVASPMLGLVENRLKSAKVAYSPERTAGHLVTNVLGAGLATVSIALARRFPGTAADPVRFSNDEIFSVFLMISTVVVLYFVYGQQVGPRVRHSSEDLGEAEQVSRIQREYENSLARWHQIANVLHLVTMTFVATTSFMYVLAVSMLHAKRGSPLEFTWEAGLTISSALLFALACGLPQSRKNRSVFLTFLTGTPAIMVTAILWVSFFKDSFGRNAFALVSTTLAYAFYVALVLWDLYDRGEAPRPHYFAALSFASLLALLMAGLYFSY